jgi:IPT/TIG domain
MALAPQAFSYGTEILFVGTTAAPASGNVTLDLVGHGFIGSNGNATTVTVGGQIAKVVTAPHQSFAPSSDQFPISAYDEMQVLVATGTAGPADITVAGTAGTSTLKGAFTYLPGVMDFASADKFTNILYDSKRNRVYLSAGNKIDVFDASAHMYLPPIVPPSVSAAPLFQGLALTPNGSTLLVTNFSDLALVSINPDNPSSATEVQLIPGTMPVGVGGSDVAAINANRALILLAAQSSSGPLPAPLYEVDLGTLAVTPLSGAGLPSFNLSSEFHISATSAGDKVFVGGTGGGAYLWDIATNQWVSWGGVVNNNGVASGDGYWFATDYTSLDSQLIEHTQTQIPEYFADFFLQGPQGAVAGEKMNASGSLLYQPLLHGVDVIDVNSGAWLRRIALTEQVQFVQNAMALDETGHRLFLITDAGLTVLQMDSPPLSIGYLTPAIGPAAGGTPVTIRGSGFQPTATVTFGGIAATTTFVDASTLQVTTPPLPTGGVRVTISNSASSSYSLDAAFQAN